uniref:Alanyl-tRNA editing protein n=1 Tax=Fervidicoccus fontis TaxID=683846 RepID=A0A7J3ZKD0_9CREN
MFVTRLLFQEDSYAREFEATVIQVEGERVVLDQTQFHPTPYGGLDTDTGYLENRRGVARVLKAEMKAATVYHVVDKPELFQVGDRVRGIVDWQRRYNMMRLHTAAHIITSVLHEKYGVMVTGGHITPEYARDDFDIQIEDWKEAIEEAVRRANVIAAECIDVKIYWVSMEEALRIPGVVKLAERLPPQVDRLRIVEIPGVDVQADGGPHVRNTCEIGEIVLVKTESRGRRKKRAYYTLKELADRLSL